MIKQVLKKNILYKKLISLIDERIHKHAINEGKKREKQTRIDIWSSIGALGVEKIVKDMHGFKINCYLDSRLSMYIFYDMFEKDELLFLKRYLREGDTFIDVGSNIGVFSLFASSIVKDKGKVVAIEPTSKTFKRLLDNMSLNKAGNILSYNIALSNQRGSATLNISSNGFDAWNSLTKPSAGIVVDMEEVSVETLDVFASNENLSDDVTLIKIDVEGWEKAVLEGGEKFLADNPQVVLLVEFTNENCKNAGYSTEELFDKLTTMGYYLFEYDSENNKLIQESRKRFYSYKNLIATKQVELVMSRLR